MRLWNMHHYKEKRKVTPWEELAPPSALDVAAAVAELVDAVLQIPIPP
jgi:hypothetical protein